MSASAPPLTFMALRVLVHLAIEDRRGESVVVPNEVVPEPDQPDVYDELAGHWVVTDDRLAGPVHFALLPARRGSARQLLPTYRAALAQRLMLEHFNKHPDTGGTSALVGTDDFTGPLNSREVEEAQDALVDMGLITGISTSSRELLRPELTPAGRRVLRSPYAPEQHFESRSSTSQEARPPTLTPMAPSGGFRIDKAGVAKMVREMQREFDKHPVRVPVEAAPDLEGGAAGAQSTTNNYGPVINVVGDGAQLAWDNGPVVQGQGPVQQQIAPGFEAVAAAVAATLRDLPAAGLPQEDAQTATEAAQDVLAEVVKETPNPSLVRRGVAALKGVLTPLALGIQTGAADEAQEWGRTAVEQLGQVF